MAVAAPPGLLVCGRLTSSDGQWDTTQKQRERACVSNAGGRRLDEGIVPPALGAEGKYRKRTREERQGQSQRRLIDTESRTRRARRKNTKTTSHDRFRSAWNVNANYY